MWGSRGGGERQAGEEGRAHILKFLLRDTTRAEFYIKGHGSL